MNSSILEYQHPKTSKSSLHRLVSVLAPIFRTRFGRIPLLVSDEPGPKWVPDLSHNGGGVHPLTCQ